MTHVSILRTHTCVIRHSYSLHQYPDISALNRPNQYAIQQNWKISLRFLQPLGNDSLNDSLDTVTKTNSIPSEEFEEE